MFAGMNRRQFIHRSAAAAASAAVLSGCGGKESAVSAETLNIYIWAEYLPKDVEDEFAKEAGCKVQVDTYTSNEELIAKAETGSCGYDLVCPSQYAVSDMARRKLLAELDRAALTNYGNLEPRFTRMAADPGGKFCVPYLGASTGIGYNKAKLPNPPRKWAGLFDPAVLEPLKQRISILDDSRESLAIALMALGFSANTKVEAEIRQAGELFKKQKPYVACYDAESFEDKLAGGSCVLAHGYAGDFVKPLEENPDLDFYLPEEGARFNMDCLCVLAESPRKALAMKFINFILRPEIAARISSGTGYPSANAKAAPLIDAKLKQHPCFQIPPDGKGTTLEDPGDDVKAIYQAVWEEVKLA